MSEQTYKILTVAKELNISIHTLAEHLRKKGFTVDEKPMAKITDEMYKVLLSDFQADKKAKEESMSLEISLGRKGKEELPLKPSDKPAVTEPEKEESDEILIKNTALGSQNREEKVKAPKIEEKPEPVAEEVPVTAKEEDEDSKPEFKVVGKIDLDSLGGKRGKKKAEEKKPEEKKTEEKKVTKAKGEEKPKTKAKEVVKEVEETPVAEEKPVEAKKKVVPPVEKVEEEADAPVEPTVMKPKMEKLQGLTIMGKIDLPVTPERRKVASSDGTGDDKKKRKRKSTFVAGSDNIKTDQFRDIGKDRAPGAQPVNRGPQNRQPAGGPNDRFGRRRPVIEEKKEITDKEIQDKIKNTLAKLTGNRQGSGNRQKLRRQKRDLHAQRVEEEMAEQELDSKTLKATEFVSANELAKMMNVPVTEVITTCFNLGMMVSINQRLDAETITIVADEFGYKVEFVGAESVEDIEEEIDDPESLVPRAPIVTIMGHVDHGKTSLLDYIRSANVVAGEAGGITQHIGAYEVKLPTGKRITFLDTPGHEAFTAMRARGAKVTDIVIVVVAADDSVMPQTKEAISHAQAANVPIVFAINKIDREGANSDRIREQLAAMNILVEEWGGKYQAQEISAKKGLYIDLLLEKVLLEAEMLDLKANPDRRAVGTVVEAQLDKGRGIVATVLIQTGTLNVGDPILAGSYSGRVRALLNERNQKVKSAGPSTPVMVLGFNGAPQAGDKLIVTESEQEAKDKANKRQQLQREQGLRTHKHITLDEIGRRLAIGNFKELKLIVKGDVDGSVEALSDSLLKLSTEQVAVNVIHKSVGQISESDVLLASASDAIIIGFQVRPSPSARKLAEAEEIDIRSYSIIYTAIEEIKLAIEGMLEPTMEEKVVCTVEVRDVFKITKVGTIAGCYVTEGKINRNTKIRLLRDGVIQHTGELDSLKRFKDDVKEVATGYECGLSIKNFNDIRIGDVIEGFEEVEVKRKLS